MNSRLGDTDRCVMCGLCLPHCPTYGLNRHEGDSPRGRISLMQGLASGHLTADDRVTAHLDGCLGCRACESVCPSGVPFGRLMDETRALLREHRTDRPEPPALIRPLLRANAAGRAATSLLRLYQGIGLHPVVRRLPPFSRGALARAMELLPDRPVARMPRGCYPPPGLARGRVQLFTGCTGAAFEGSALTAARDLLLAQGFQVEIPAGQGCCGALDQHAGRRDDARTLAHRNLAAFGGDDTPVISLNSGCRTQLREYADLLPESDAECFAGRVRDLCGFILEQGPDRLPLDTGQATVAVHLPCTLRNVLKEHGRTLALLQRLPGLQVVELDGNERCCGAAGTHMLTHPEMADRLLTPKIEAVKRLNPDALITANIGCSLHFQAGLKRAELAVPVMTPGEWLAARLRADPA